MSTWQAGGWLDGVRWLPSPNVGERPAGSKVSLVVIHNISLPPDEFGGNWVEDFFLNRLDPAAHPYFATIADLQVSAHFYVRRDGRVIQFVAQTRHGYVEFISRMSGVSTAVDIAFQHLQAQPAALFERHIFGHRVGEGLRKTAFKPDTGRSFVLPDGERFDVLHSDL